MITNIYRRLSDASVRIPVQKRARMFPTSLERFANLDCSFRSNLVKTFSGLAGKFPARFNYFMET